MEDWSSNFKVALQIWLPPDIRGASSNKRAIEERLLCKEGDLELELETGCSCYNCRELAAGLAECPICLEGYRSVGVCACPHCANVTCWRCGAKLTACPFCRRPVTAPPVRNHAMERLIAKLQLPCSPVLLREDKLKEPREDSSTICPENCWRSCLLAATCNWKGDVSELATHLEVSHQVSVLVGSSITVEIGGFRSKVRASSTKTRQYIVSLASYASLFLCQISLQKKRLRLEFSGVTVSTNTKLNNGPKFGAWLEVCSSSRTMKGIMPISVNHGKSKELFISCDGLLSPWRNSDDQVTISITIRPLN
uniref:E3 ubiquitin-protein ligase n=1 Tax=Rhodnius prolixus TaxID=13249 RepID=T1I7R8_RHOPR